MHTAIKPIIMLTALLLPESHIEENASDVGSHPASIWLSDSPIHNKRVDRTRNHMMYVLAPASIETLSV